MKKLLVTILCIFVLMSSGCSGTKEEPMVSQLDTSKGITIRIGALRGPTSIGMVKMMKDSEAGLTENNYEVTIAGSADEVTPKLIQGDFDIAAVPSNLAAILYNNTEGAIKLLAVNSLGLTYLVEKNGEKINSISDLKDQTIYSMGKGSNPEYIMNYLLQSNGLDPERDVTMEWKSEPTEVVSALSQTDYGIAILSQPFATVAQTKLDNLRIALDLNEEWVKLDNASVQVTGVYVVRSEFAKEHPEAIASFLSDYQASAKYVNSNIDEAAELVEHYGIVDAAIAKKAIPYCNITALYGAEMMNSARGFYEVLFDQNPASVGKTLPDDNFYYVHK